TQSVNQQLKLKSSSGVDYKKLRDLLAARKWREADKETLRVILTVAKREQQGWLNTSSIDNFSCEDLRIIDQLWVKYSNGKFGFSVQRKIYQGLGGTRNYDKKIWEAFGDKVGWRRGGQWFYYQDITFDNKAQKVQFGNFPRMYNKKYMYILVYMLIFSRVDTCKL
ncbi:MAG: GUN4 domain-containing protein, partial [Dolichospermum sp.]